MLLKDKRHVICTVTNRKFSARMILNYLIKTVKRNKDNYLQTYFNTYVQYVYGKERYNENFIKI